MKLHNTYYILRHGEAISNVKNMTSSWPETFENPLTEDGIAQAEAAGDELKNKGIEMIFASDVLRTKETAEIVAKKLDLTVQFDKRLREIDFGELNGKPIEELFYASFAAKEVKARGKNSETYEQVLARVTDFMNEKEKEYERKTILIVSHQCPLWILENYVKGFTLEHGVREVPRELRIQRGEIRELK